MSVTKLLLWEKYRPKTIEDIVLPNRIKDCFKNGITQNYIFYGHYGTGKTSLARILIGKYSKNTPYLEINSSLYTSIDILRSEIEDFCKFTSIFESDSDIKYIFLDEFERVSAQFQDAFKAFIEKYNKNVRFIITTNHINKISDGIKSRIPQINFDCLNSDEERYLKIEMFKRTYNLISIGEGIDIDKNNLKSIITKNFPDFRSVLVEVQKYIETGNVSDNNPSSVDCKLDLYNLIYEGNISYTEIYNFLMINFGPDKIDVMINLLGKQFIDWSISENKNIEKLFQCNYVISDYSSKLEQSTDPIVLGLTIIGKLRDILKD